MKINDIRRILYTTAKILGDINAIQKGRIGQRIKRRIAGKVAGRILKRLFK